eukprot:scaffold57264_cov29-Tisochrysis_lutea.AAC.2
MANREATILRSSSQTSAFSHDSGSVHWATSFGSNSSEESGTPCVIVLKMLHAQPTNGGKVLEKEKDLPAASLPISDIRVDKEGEYFIRHQNVWWCAGSVRALGGGQILRGGGSAPSSRLHSDTWLVRHGGIPGRKSCVQLASGVG